MKNTLMKWLIIILIGVIYGAVMTYFNIKVNETWWAGVIFALIITKVTIYMEE